MKALEAMPAHRAFSLLEDNPRHGSTGLYRCACAIPFGARMVRVAAGHGRRDGRLQPADDSYTDFLIHAPAADVVEAAVSITAAEFEAGRDDALIEMRNRCGACGLCARFGIKPP
jgi:hypothetical protein